MVEEKIQAGITVKPYYGSERPITGANSPVATKTINFILEPSSTQKEETDPYAIAPELENLLSPNTYDREIYNVPTLTTKPLVINIETSGLEFDQDRIVVIGVKDPTVLDTEVTLFDDDIEEDLIKRFMDFYVYGGYNELIGWNTDFDYTFIIHKLMKYRMYGKEFVNAKIFDLMVAFQKGTLDFVPTTNKTKRLNFTAKDILGAEAPIEDEDALKAYVEGNKEPMLLMDRYHVIVTTYLYALYQGVALNSYTVKSNDAFSNLSSDNPGYTTQTCSNCLANNEVPKGQTGYVCSICGYQNNTKV